MSFLSYFLQSLVLNWFIVTLIKREYDNPEVHGRELVLKTPLRFCRDRWSARNMDRQVCVEYLRKNDLYSRLLDDYPHASIVWAQSLSKSLQG